MFNLPPNNKQTIQSNSFDFGFSETKYSHFLCFKVSTRTNKLAFSQLKGISCNYAVSYFKDKIFGNSKCIINDDLLGKLKN